MRPIPLLLVLLVFTGSVLHAQTKPERMNGLLWEISGNGIKKKGYLYGTMHISEKLAFNLSDTFFIALRQVDMVGLETNHFEWPDFTNRLRNSRDGDGGNSRGYGNGYNSQNLYNDAFKFTTPSNEMLGSILAYKPRMSNEFLYRTNEGRQDYEEDTYLDQFIFQSGHKLGKTVIGLETLEGSYESVTKAQLPDPDEDKDKDNERTYLDPNKLEEAYRSQDLTMLDSLHKAANPGKTFQRWMLTERNIIMANRIDSILQSGTALFSAVGAAHLPGEMGVILLLRKKGYTMRPVHFTNAMGNKDKEEIDALRYPTTLSRQWARDSSWSVDAPGKFYPTTEQRGFTQALCADMGNGSYYAVAELNTYGWWTGQSPTYLAERLDSLLYEQVPGRILERKRLTAPYPGHEISTRTKRGDVLRYKIFFTPLKMYVFMASGSGDYALGEEANHFLNSIQFTTQAALSQQPRTVRHPDYTVTFPADLLENSTLDPKANQFLAASATTDGAVYFLYRTTLHDLDFIEEDSFELNIIGERIATQFTKKSPQAHLIAETPYPTQDVSFRSDRDSSYLFGRLVIDGPRYYLLGCRKKSPEPPTAFFESFSLDKTATLSTREKVETDTSMHFRATYQTALAEEKTDVFFEKLDRMREEAYKKMRESPDYRRQYYDNDEEADDDTQNTRIVDPYTGEEVKIGVYTMPADEELPALDSLKRRIVKEATNHGDRPVRSTKWDVTNNILTGELVVEDTNSTRGIRTKYVLINRKMYTLGAVVNLNAPESPFIQHVFNSFTPTDSVLSTSLLQTRDVHFLQDIYAQDSVKRKDAIKELGKMPSSAYRPEHFAAVQAAIQHADFGKLKFGVRTDLLCALGAIHTPEAAALARNFYENSPDSAHYQLLALYTLAQMQTKPAFEALFDLWLQRPVDLESYESRIFSELEDSLKLTAQFAKQLVKLAQNADYQNNALDLLDKLREEKLIKPAAISDLKPILIAQTKWQIFKNQYQNEEKRDREANGDRYYNSYLQQSSAQIITRNFQFLAPFLRKDKAVRALTEQAIQYGDQKLQLATYRFYLENGIGVASEKLKPFSEDDETRLQLFQTLAATGTLAQYPGDWFADTLAMMRSYLLYDNRSDNNQKIDSIRLLSQYASTLNGKPATVYFFDLKYKKNKKWGLGNVKAIPDFRYLLYGDAFEKLTGKNYYKSQAFRYKATSSIVAEVEPAEKEALIRKKIGSTRFDHRQRYQEIDVYRNRRYYGN